MTCTHLFFLIAGIALALFGWRGWQRRRLSPLDITPRTARWSGAAFLAGGVLLALGGIALPTWTEPGGWLLIGAVVCSVLGAGIINWEKLRRVR